MSATPGGPRAPSLRAADPWYVGLDIGASKTAAVVAAGDGAAIAYDEVATELGDPDRILERASALIAGLLQAVPDATRRVRAIGACAPGRVTAGGTIQSRFSLVGVTTVLDLAGGLGAAFGLPVVVENDANAGALGEASFGAATGHADVAYVTVSTGIGCGVLVDGRLHRGAHGLAGEAAHVVVDPDGPVCRCGARGCAEAVASGRAIAEAATTALDRGAPSPWLDRARAAGALTARDVLEAAAHGDVTAVAVVEAAAASLARLLATLGSLYDPGVIVLGGGVMQAGDALWRPLRRTYAAYRAVAGTIPLVPAALGSRSGVFGAVAVAHQGVTSDCGVTGPAMGDEVTLSGGDASC